MGTKFSDVSASNSWAAGDSLQGITAANDELRLLIEAIVGTSANPVPTKMHPGATGIESIGPILVNPGGVAGPSGGDDMGVAGSGNRGIYFYTTGPNGLITLYMGDSTNGISALQLQWSQQNNHFTIVRGDGRIRLENGGHRIYNSAAGAYGSLITRFNNWADFTPTLYGTTSTTSVAPTYVTSPSADYGQWGRYKVENTTCTFVAHVALTAVGSVSGSIRLGGLPETAASNTPGVDYPVSIGRVNECSNAADMRASVGQNSTYVELFRLQNSSSADAANIVDTNLGDDFMIRVSGSYPI